jgi:hypothetical protein
MLPECSRSLWTLVRSASGISPNAQATLPCLQAPSRRPPHALAIRPLSYLLGAATYYRKELIGFLGLRPKMHVVEVRFLRVSSDQSAPKTT